MCFFIKPLWVDAFIGKFGTASLLLNQCTSDNKKLIQHSHLVKNFISTVNCGRKISKTNAIEFFISTQNWLHSVIFLLTLMFFWNGFKSNQSFKFFIDFRKNSIRVYHYYHAHVILNDIVHSWLKTSQFKRQNIFKNAGQFFFCLL